MKSQLIIILAGIAFPFFLMAQEAKIEEADFDKLVIKGEVETLNLNSSPWNMSVITIEGIAQDDVEYSISAGVLELNVQRSAKPVIINMANQNLKRISGPEGMQITGAEVIGGVSGNYLVTCHKIGLFPGLAWTDKLNVNIPALDLNIQIPELPALPALDFNFPDTDFNLNWNGDQETLKKWQHNLKDNQDEIKELNKELSEELKKNMENLKEEMEKLRKDN